MGTFFIPHLVFTHLCAAQLLLQSHHAFGMMTIKLLRCICLVVLCSAPHPQKSVLVTFLCITHRICNYRFLNVYWHVKLVHEAGQWGFEPEQHHSAWETPVWPHWAARSCRFRSWIFGESSFLESPFTCKLVMWCHCHYKNTDQSCCQVHKNKYFCLFGGLLWPMLHIHFSWRRALLQIN